VAAERVLGQEEKTPGMGVEHRKPTEAGVAPCASLLGPLVIGLAVALMTVPPAGAGNVLSIARHDVGRNPTGWSHQWCAKWLDMVLRRAGKPGGGNLARAYASYGRPSHARVGAIAVMATHVGIVTHVGKGFVTLISGNHSGRSGHRTVGYGNYRMSRIIAFRAP
jgi:hypothetical protein